MASCRRIIIVTRPHARYLFGRNVGIGAHLNAVEAFAPFAALVLIAHIAGAANDNTAVWAAVFFWSRVAHAVVYLFGIPFVRTIIFAAGFFAVVGIFYEVVS